MLWVFIGSDSGRSFQWTLQQKLVILGKNTGYLGLRTNCDLFLYTYSKRSFIIVQVRETILNKSENATPELFAIYIQNYAYQECKWTCNLMFEYWVMQNSKSFTDVVTRKHMKTI